MEKVKCSECGVEFSVKNKPTSKEIFCSELCQKLFYNFTCPVCNKKFHFSDAELKRRKFCSAECRKVGSKLVVPKKKCEICGKMFQPKSSVSRFCSDKCYGKNKRKNKKFKLVCEFCGDTFVSTSKYSRFCSNECKYAVIYSKEVKNTYSLGFDPYKSDTFMHEHYIGGIYRQTDPFLGF